MREIIDISRDWKFIKGDFAPEALERKLGQAEAVDLPHSWNAIDGQDGGNDYDRCQAYYVKMITSSYALGQRVYLEIEGASLQAEVFLAGKILGSHAGAFSTFRVDLTEALRNQEEEEALLAIRVDNREQDGIYPQKADFTFYGGIYRKVKLICVPEEHFELLEDGGPGIWVDSQLDLEKREAKVRVRTKHNAKEVEICLAGQSQRVAEEAEFTLTQVHLWDGLEDPYLYEVRARLDSKDEVKTRFGCRQFACDPARGFLLNGREYPLRGVSRHQDRKGMGNAISMAELQEDMQIIEELGANTLRLAHYQHAQEFYDLCDEKGIVVWAEIPYITLHQRAGRENTILQMRELIAQCYNHPSIAVWGLSNEITAASMVDEDMLENHRQLQALCKQMDPGRMTTMANVFMLETDSPLLEIPDINSYNLYFGWYLGELEENDQFFDDYHAKYPQRVIGLSEYGADANPQYHSSSPSRGDYSEEYQCIYHEHMLIMIEQRPYLWASHVWNLFDFGADGRDEGGKHGENQKGLVSFDRQLKKDAFYLYKATWNQKEPFVHLCGKRYQKRAEDRTQIKIYSNQRKVDLYANGKWLASQEGERIFTFDIELVGQMEIKAVAGNCTDRMRLEHVEEVEKSYLFNQSAQELSNWFDQEIDPAYFSVEDRLGELQGNPKAAVIVQNMMTQASASRGDVAESVKDNPALQRMLARMTLRSLLKQAGTKAELVQELNRILQEIKKE